MNVDLFEYVSEIVQHQNPELYGEALRNFSLTMAKYTYEKLVFHIEQLGYHEIKNIDLIHDSITRVLIHKMRNFSRLKAIGLAREIMHELKL